MTGLVRGAEAGSLVQGQTSSDGLVWDPASRLFVPGELVRSVNGRTGEVLIADGDVTSTQVTNLSEVNGANVSLALNALLTMQIDTTEAIEEINEEIEIRGANNIQPFTTLNGPVAVYRLNGDLLALPGCPVTAPLVVSGTAVFADVVPGRRGFFFNSTTRLGLSAYEPLLALVGDMTILTVWQFDAQPMGPLVGHGAAGETADANNLYSLASDQTGPPFLLSSFWENGVGDNVLYSTLPPASLSPIHNLMLLGQSRTGGVVQHYVNGLPFGAPSGVLAAPNGGSSGRFVVGGNSTSNFAGRGLCWGVKILAFGYTEAQHRAEYNATLGQGFGAL